MQLSRTCQRERTVSEGSKGTNLRTTDNKHSGSPAKFTRIFSSYIYLVVPLSPLTAQIFLAVVDKSSYLDLSSSSYSLHLFIQQCAESCNTDLSLLFSNSPLFGCIDSLLPVDQLVHCLSEIPFIPYNISSSS